MIKELKLYEYTPLHQYVTYYFPILDALHSMGIQTMEELRTYIQNNGWEEISYIQYLGEIRMRNLREAMEEYEIDRKSLVV